MALSTRAARPLSRLHVPITSVSRALSKRSFQSAEHPPLTPFSPAESAILSSALAHVPEHGFSKAALRLGAREAGYLDISTNLFPRGAFDLVNYHLVTRRLALKDEVQFPTTPEAGKTQQMTVQEKLRTLVLARLRANEPVRHKWQEAIALMAQPSYIPPSLAELARLADEIWFLAGDTSVDSNWYTKRASLSALYSATEVFMTQDKSHNFKDTEEFLDSKLKDLGELNNFLGGVGDWVNFTGHSIVNVLRSKGMPI